MRSFSLSTPALALLLAPFITLFCITPWGNFHLDYGDSQSVIVSLGLGGIALAFIIILGTPLAWWLARSHSHWRKVAEIIVLVPLLTPPLAMGMLLVSAYGPYSSLGRLLHFVGVSLNNNPPAFVLAQIYAAMPWYVLSARAAFEHIPRDIEDVAQTLGANWRQIFIRLSLPLSARGLATGAALAWSRIIGEFGVVMVFCYFPQGIPVKLYINLQDSGVNSVYTLLWLLLVTALPLPLWCLMRHRTNPSLT
ncbi:molybdate ABC transporter permease subunit [Celerinatantimonas sp. MCCC 1A17872]|uniref:molybdate ABC transporter permease subunit n=1 Tax=Celerinatantimonas sp. MCCC 1A17872 TaxID=3177514 RepID=UPI0038C07DBB